MKAMKFGSHICHVHITKHDKFILSCFTTYTVQPPNCNTSELPQPLNYDTVVWSRFFCYISLVLKTFLYQLSPVKPLFCDIDEWENETSRSMRCPTGARRRHIFSLSFPTNESTSLLNACVLNLAFRQ